MSMTDAEFIESLRLLIVAHQTPDIPPVTSPTGRAPKLLWTPKWQTTYTRMKTEADAGLQTLGATWYRLILANANGNRYGDTGLWATLMYQITGDVAWVSKALAKMQPFLTTQVFGNGNDVREFAIERVVLLDWLWPGLTDEQRALHLTRLDAMFVAAFVAPWLPPEMPIRVSDSDQVTGVYLGVACYNAAFGDIHPPAKAMFEQPFIGGYVSTGQNRLTLRNAITDYVAMAAGGEWIEGASYNVGTTKLLMLGAEGVRTATGVNHFPEVTAWKPGAATRMRHFFTPNRKQTFQYGDDQYPRAMGGRLYAWVTNLMLFDDPHARQMVLDLVAQYGATGPLSAEPWPRGFLQFDPYGPVAPVETLPTVFHAPGQGIVSVRSSWALDASQAMLHHPPIASVDHALHYHGDVQFYQKGSWALTHPITYGGVGNDGRGCNVMLHAGIGAPLEYRGANAVYRGPGWEYFAGTVGGSILPQNYYNPPPTWFHEHSRSILILFGADADTIIIHDRTHLDDPKTIGGIARYSAANQLRLQAVLRQWRWHAPVTPTIAGTSASWPISSGTARVSWLGQDLQATAVDQTLAWAADTAVVATEKKFHLLLTAPDTAGFQSRVTVLECGDPAMFATILPLDLGDVQGVRLSRVGEPDRVALFNAVPGPPLPNQKVTYDPAVPGLLATRRLRTTPVPAVTGTVWQPETAAGVEVIG